MDFFDQSDVKEEFHGSSMKDCLLHVSLQQSYNPEINGKFFGFDHENEVMIVWVYFLPNSITVVYL